MKTMPGLLLVVLLVLSAAGVTLNAAPPKAHKTTALPPATIQTVDYTNMSFTVALHDTNLTVLITSGTRFFKGGQPAISRDLAVGDLVRGTLHPVAGGRPEAVRIIISASPAK